MLSNRNRLLGLGLYTIPEGARLTGVPGRSIRRWLLGYRYRRDDATHAQPSVWRADAPTVDGVTGLSSLDLIEVRFVHAFRQHGVSWKVIRLAAERACEEFQRTHPFVSRRFKTDGRWIVLETIEETGERNLLDLVRNQFEFEKIVAPLLKGGLEFADDDEVVRWWPRIMEQADLVTGGAVFEVPYNFSGKGRFQQIQP